MTAYNVINRFELRNLLPEDIADVLANLDAIAIIINGELDWTNLKEDAMIKLSQLEQNGTLGGVVFNNGSITVPQNIFAVGDIVARSTTTHVGIGGLGNGFPGIQINEDTFLYRTAAGVLTTNVLHCDNLQERTEKGQANGYAPLDGVGKISVSFIPDLSAWYQLLTAKGQANGYAPLDAASKVPVVHIPDLSATYQPRSEEGQPNGYASLDAAGLVPISQLPAPATGDLELYQLRDEEGQPNGYASLDAGGKVPIAQLPPTSGEDLTPYQLRSEEGQPNGYAGLDATGKVPSAQLPAGQDLSGYQLRSEEGQANGYAGLDATGKVPAAQLPTPPDLAPYQLRSEEGVANGYASLDATGKVPAAQLPPVGSFIPGEVRMWPGSALPAQATYGKWVWADGAVYSSATYPIAAGHIAAGWRTAFGAADPGAGNFRVPDMRGVLPAGMDGMPGGARANRITRGPAGTLAANSGTEYHTITQAEMPNHAHTVSENPHTHGAVVNDPGHGQPSHGIFGGYSGGNSGFQFADGVADGYISDHISNSGTGISVGINAASVGVVVNGTGGSAAHENLPPTVFVPYIVKLDG